MTHLKYTAKDVEKLMMLYKASNNKFVFTQTIESYVRQILESYPPEVVSTFLICLENLKILNKEGDDDKYNDEYLGYILLKLNTV